MVEAGNRSGPERAVGAIRVLVASVLVAAAAVLLTQSLDWPLPSDAALMLYLGRIVAVLDRVPYREVWDLHPPGVFLAYGFIGELSGYTGRGARLADVTLVAALAASTWAWMRRFGALPAWAAAACLALIHVHSVHTLQREVVALPPMMAAITWLAFSRRAAALAAAGAAIGCAATIRPGLLIALPVVAAWALWRKRRDPAMAKRRVVIWLAVGAALPLAIAALYLIAIGALGAFLGVAWQYWPLYARMDGSVFSVPSPLGALRQWAWTFVTHPAARWIPAAGVGFWLAWPRSEDADRERLLLVAGLGAAFAINAGLVGHFAAQHWLPLMSITVPLACLSLMSTRGFDLDRFGAAALALTILTMGLTLKAPDEFLRRWTLGPSASVEQVEFQRVAASFGAMGGRALRVQPLGWAWADASLMSGAQPATSFVSDVPFIHHRSHPYIRSLQERFLAEFDAHPPDVILCPLMPRQPIAEPDLRDYPWLVTRLRNYRPYHRTQFFILYSRAAP